MNRDGTRDSQLSHIGTVNFHLPEHRFMPVRPSLISALSAQFPCPKISSRDRARPQRPNLTPIIAPNLLSYNSPISPATDAFR